MTVSLKDQDGTVLNSKVVDFPLESVVVSGAYDDNTKKVVLTLQNGSTIDFSVADLIEGLQAEITSSNKLDSDLVDDTSQTNKFVTATDISNWNGKQDSIADLSTIRSGASAGATAVQPEDLSTVATTGSYTDLLNKPTIPSAQIQSDWNQGDNTKLDYIKNKPTIPTVPSNVSAFTNDSGYITSSALSGYATENWVTNKGYITGIDSSDVVTALGYTPYNSSNPNGYTSNVGTVTSVNNNLPDSNGNVTISGVTIDQTYDGTSANAQSGVAIEGELSTNYQEKLSSGTNIKTVNNTTLLGNGNIDTSEIFLAVQGTTTFSQISTAYNSGMTILLKDENNDIGYLLRLISGAEADFIVGSNTLISVDDTNNWTRTSNYLNIPNAQVNSDWNANSGVAQILNKPTIPTVNNKTITIQKNSTTVDSFTLNQSSNKTINITVPTNTNELTNGAGFITGITSSDVITALGYTPYNSTNPNGYITSSALGDYVKQETTETIILYAWFKSTATIHTIYTTTTTGSDVNCYDSNLNLVARNGIIASSQISTSIGTYERRNSYDINITRQTLTDNSENVLNIKQADGQWIYNESILSSSNLNVGTYDLGYAIQSYLPDDGYSYEVKIFVQYDSKNTTASLIKFNGYMFFWGDAYGTSNTECKSARDSVIINSSRTLSMEIQNGKPADLIVTALCYRRLGTNS